MMSINVLFITLLKSGIIFGNYLDAEANYNRSPKVERNNIVNKGVWIRNYRQNDKTGNFLFRGNSVDVDNIVQGDFNAFGSENLQNSPFISSYVERNKRDTNIGRKRIRKSLSNCNSKNCNTNAIEDKPSLVKSKLITKLKPASVFNDYPYEIAFLLNNDKEALDVAKNYSTYVINEMLKNENYSVIPLTENNNITNKIDELVNAGINKTNNTVPKRSMNHYETEIIKKLEINEDLIVNKTDEAKNYSSRNIFAKDDKSWVENTPTQETHRYKVLGKPEDSRVVRPVTERGLIKVLSMLTNTFKKIMKQHSDIKDIHKKLHTMNEDFLKNVEIISDKFQDFEAKYANLVTFNQKITEMEEKLNIKEQHFKTKERELSKNLVEFEIQQKKFLTQQRQFYNIQKLMLAQNERINAKQNAIAKTQSEISHRQNNFARILKKAKQVYLDKQHNIPTTTATFPKFDSSNETKATEDIDIITSTTTVKPEISTEPVKINLFSIPVASKIENQDHLLLNEKDDQPVDDLVYKYYFNNTFIDSLMKNFLSGFLNNGENNDITRNVKNKRDEATEGTTVLLPVNKSSIFNILGKVRERRWINHHSRRKWRRKNRGKVAAAEKTDTDDDKFIKKRIENTFENLSNKVPNTIDVQKGDPFISMATGFCHGIGQNTSQQVLDWCVEKALRRLQNIVQCMKSTSRKHHDTTENIYDIVHNNEFKEASKSNDIRVPPPPSAPVQIERKPSPLVPVPLELEMKVEPERRRIIENNILPESTTLLTEANSEPTTIIQQFSTSITSQPEVTIVPTYYTPISTVKAIETSKTADAFFPDNEKLESNLKEFEMKPDTEGNVYYDGSLHASDVIKDGHVNSGESDLMPGLESNSRIDNMDPYSFDPKAMRREFLKRSFYSRMKYESLLNKMKKL